MITKLLGIGLYCLCLGIWVIGLLIFAVWTAVFILPGALICFAAGYTINIFGRTSQWNGFRYHWIWKTVRGIFNFEVVYTHETALPFVEGKGSNDGQTAIWGIYPHGHFSLTHVFYFILNPKFSNTVPAIHSILFYIPLFGSLAGWLGAIPVVEKDMRNALYSKKSIIMAPGGISDSYLTGNEVKKHHGFLRIACEMGRPVIPVWCPDERSYYSQWLPLGITLEKLFFFPIPMFVWGRWWWGLLPKLPPTSRILIGEPIVFKDCDMQPLLSLEEGEKKYWDELRRLQELARNK
jgi:hypothetical protein